MDLEVEYKVDTHECVHHHAFEGNGIIDMILSWNDYRRDERALPSPTCMALWYNIVTMQTTTGYK